MKDKKTIAIVALAAITAGFAIFSFVNNTSKLKANSKLKAEKAELNKDLKNIQTERDEFRTQRDQLDAKSESLNQKVLAQDETITELSKAVEVKQEEMSALEGQVTEKTSEIESMKLQHAQDLGELEAKLKVTTENLVTVQGELKVQTDLATAKAKEAQERGETASNLEAKNKGLSQEKEKLELDLQELEAKINETSKQLAESNGKRKDLEDKLSELQEQQAELEKQMNDIEFLEAQYKRVKSEIAIAKRLDWMRRGVGIYKNRKPLDEVRPNIVLKNRISSPEKSQEKQADVKAPVGAAESVSVELTSDGRVIIDGKVVEPTQAEKSISEPKE